MNFGSEDYRSESIDLIGFAGKWLNRLAEELQNHNPVTPEITMDQEKHKVSSFALGIAKLLNIFDRPFFYLGIVFLLWLVTEAMLQWLLPAPRFDAIATEARKYTKFVGPAVIGYWTNWLAIKMLFHPRRANRLWQGLIPARRHELIQSLAAGIHQRLFSAGIVREFLRTSPLLEGLVYATERVTNDAEFRKEIKNLSRIYLERLLNRPEISQSVRQLVGEAIDGWRAKNFLEKPVELTKGVWGPWVQERIVAAVPELTKSMEGLFDLYDQWLDKLPSTISNNQQQLEVAVVAFVEQSLELLDIQQIITKQLAKMDEAQLEEALTGNVLGELVFIQTSGGLFGLLVALALEYPMVRLPLMAGGVGLWLFYKKSNGI